MSRQATPSGAHRKRSPSTTAFCRGTTRRWQPEVVIAFPKNLIWGRNRTAGSDRKYSRADFQWREHCSPGQDWLQRFDVQDHEFEEGLTRGSDAYRDG